MIRLVIKGFQQRRRDNLDVVRDGRQLHGAVTVFGVEASVEVDAQRAVVEGTGFQTLIVIRDPP